MNKYSTILCIALLSRITEPDDCLGNPGGDATIDSCGVCNGDGSTCAAQSLSLFSLSDINPYSSTYSTNISLDDNTNKVQLYYFPSSST